MIIVRNHERRLHAYANLNLFEFFARSWSSSHHAFHHVHHLWPELQLAWILASAAHSAVTSLHVDHVSHAHHVHEESGQFGMLNAGANFVTGAGL